MKRIGLWLPLVLFTGGCAYPVTTYQGGYRGRYPMQPRPYGPQVNITYSPVGRWDNVMLTAAGTPLFVLMMNGDIANGEILSATHDNLRLHVAAGEVDLAASDVMRVDRVTNNRDLVKDGARGAAYGAGVVAVLGLIAGHVPPPRLFAAGGIIGGAQGVQDSLAARVATTIYLARGAAPIAHASQPGAAEPPALHIGPGVPCGAGKAACSSQVGYRR